MLIRLGLKKLDNGNQFISVSINSSRVIVSIQYFRSQSHRQTLYVFCLPECYQVRRLFTKSDDLRISMWKRHFISSNFTSRNLKKFQSHLSNTLWISLLYPYIYWTIWNVGMSRLNVSHIAEYIFHQLDIEIYQAVICRVYTNELWHLSASSRENKCILHVPIHHRAFLTDTYSQKDKKIR